LAQTCELHVAPPFGALVQVTTDYGVTVLGVVGHVETAGLDTGARPILRGHGDVRDQRIYAENPDLPHVLRTTFRSLVVGFLDTDGVYLQYLPPWPPQLHYSVHLADARTIAAFSDAGLDYLRTLLAASDTPSDELVAANVRLVGASRGELAAFAQHAGRELSQLLRSDYTRLTAILRRIAIHDTRNPLT
jgi:hypothetical protein